ncbi:uncharacterized protein HKW66_Vig0179220 [Vigna angularis]|uniref:Uncharacterized protein n=1 Tax=Phaseolus angularis TaxID=3914 RepID=A0A8T0JZF5_PHAAN|nr:uncharacterized protein HKW66_Vig0179220 [Vigna angularis]
MSMRGIGGPLLCIGDLLNDVGEEQQGHSLRREASPTPSSSHLNDNDPPPNLLTLFQIVSCVKTTFLFVVLETLRSLEFGSLRHRPLLDFSHFEGNEFEKVSIGDFEFQ